MVTFLCGHAVATDGAAKPRCYCGESRIQRVAAKAPTFRGHAAGPCSQYEDLPAKAFTVKEQSHE